MWYNACIGGEVIKKVLFRVVALLLLCGLVLGAYLLLRSLGIFSLSREEFRDLLAGYGAWAPLAFILATFLQVTFVPIPSTVTILGGVYLFGAWASFLYSYIGLLLGASVAFFLGRLLGKPFVLWLSGDAARVEGLLARLRSRGIVLLFFMFLFPMFPDDLLCLIAGLLPISFSAFLLMQLLTRATSIGATLLFLSGEVIPYEGWGVVVIVFVCLIGVAMCVLSLVYADRFAAILDRFCAALTRPKGNKDHEVH